MSKNAGQLAAVVLYSETDGVYLGCFGPLGFWSKLDPMGQDGALTFDNEVKARAHMERWDALSTCIRTSGDVSMPSPDDLRMVPVIADCGKFASIASCVDAGLPAWNPGD